MTVNSCGRDVDGELLCPQPDEAAVVNVERGTVDSDTTIHNGKVEQRRALVRRRLFSPTTIQTMIIDRIDEYYRYGYISFQPYLSAHRTRHAVTPTADRADRAGRAGRARTFDA